MQPNATTKEPWHLDKRVPVALILTLAAQTVGVVWWAAKLDNRVESHERRIVQMEAANTRISQEAQRVSEQIARMDERLISQTAILRRIEENLAAERRTSR